MNGARGVVPSWKFAIRAVLLVMTTWMLVERLV